MKIIKNADALERDYTPQKIPHREEKLEDIMKPFQFDERGSTRMLLLGPGGSGKTTIAKKLVTPIKDKTSNINLPTSTVPGLEVSTWHWIKL